MKWFIIVAIFLPGTFFINSNKVFSQNFIPDTIGNTNQLHSAIKLYHQFLAPERELYDGSEYAYNAYYPFIINEGHPFFLSKNFDTGAIFYNNILYEKVPLLFDIIKEELLTNDPTGLYIIKLHSERTSWFTIWDHTFIRLSRDSAANPLIHTGFYDLLYQGNTTLYKKISKIIKENSASVQGINTYVVESDEYFIKKNSNYYKVKNKKSLMRIVYNRKKEIQQFIRKNKLNLRKDLDGALKKIVAYYDGINNGNIKAIN